MLEGRAHGLRVAVGEDALTDPRVVARYGLATTQVLSEGIFTDSYAQAMRSDFQHEHRA